MIALIIVASIIVIPFLVEDIGKQELNRKTRAQLDGEFIELADGVTHYELRGNDNAPTIVLVHGNAAPYFSWDHNFEALVKAGFRVLRYDVFGHGFSDRPRMTTYNRDLYDRQLEGLLWRLEIHTPVYLVGTSQGGSICAYFAAKHPDKVEKLALLSPLYDGFQGERMTRLLKVKGIGEYLMCLMGDKILTNPSRGFYSNCNVDDLIAKLKGQIRFKGKKRAVLANIRGNAMDDVKDIYIELKKQGIPVLLTWGKKDKSISGESMLRLRNVLTKLDYYELENAAHLAHYECPNQINPLLINFFQNKTYKQQ